MPAQSLRMFFATINGPSLVFFDEADTVLASSATFRPTQLYLANCKKIYPEALMVISSATLSPDILYTSLHFFGPSRPILVSTSLDRANLIVGTYVTNVFMIEQIKSLITEIAINSKAGQVDKTSILVLVSTQAESEKLAAQIREKLFGAKLAVTPNIVSLIRPFHAGLQQSEKSEALSLIGTHSCRILCCTEASIGQGIDISSVRLLFLHNMTNAVTSFIQAIGRAGRDGLASHVFCRQNFVDTTRSYRYVSSDERVSWRKVMRATWGFCTCMIYPLLKFVEGEISNESDRCGHCELCINQVVVRDITGEVALLLAEVKDKHTTFSTKQNRDGKELQIIGALSTGSIHFESGRDGGAAASLSNDDQMYNIRILQENSGTCIRQYSKTNIKDAVLTAKKERTSD